MKKAHLEDLKVSRIGLGAMTMAGTYTRLNCISPGIILTPLARDEMSGRGADGYRKMIETSATGRVGTADEVATVAAFLLESRTPASSPGATCSWTAA